MMAVTMLTTPIFLLVWVARKLRKRPAGQLKRATLISAACFVAFTALGIATADTCDHEYELAESVEAKCEEDGYEKYRCSLCGYEKTEEMEALGHEMVDGVCSRCWYAEEADDLSEVSAGAEMVLAQMAEDIAKQIATNPDTVKMNIWSQGFYRDDHLYAVQSEFSCSNAFGVEETSTVKVVALSNEDESKISPIEIYLDGELIWVREE